VFAHVFCRIPIRIGFQQESVHVRPFSSLWLHDWLHEVAADHPILKRYHVRTRAYKSNLRSPLQQAALSLFTTYPVHLRGCNRYQVHPRPGNYPYLPASIPP
jgi:hypothetical protein